MRATSSRTTSAPNGGKRRYSTAPNQKVTGYSHNLRTTRNNFFATRELIDRLFAGVDERSRRLMVERYSMGRSADELAEQAEQSPSAVRMKLMRVRGAVRKGWPGANSPVDSRTSE